MKKTKKRTLKTAEDKEMRRLEKDIRRLDRLIVAPTNKPKLHDIIILYKGQNWCFLLNNDGNCYGLTEKDGEILVKML